MKAVVVLPLLLILCRSLLSIILLSFFCQSHCVMIPSRVVVSAAADGLGTPTFSYSSFYIHPAPAAIRVDVATAAAAPPPHMAADDDDDVK